jgi:hypothetical protein
MVTNATVIIPVPGLLLTTMLGAVFNPIWEAVVPAAGQSLGELSGTLAGVPADALKLRVPLFILVRVGQDWKNAHRGIRQVLAPGFIPPRISVKHRPIGSSAASLPLPIG